MVAAAPFRGLRFDPAVVGDGAQVTAPPYDVISPEARAAYEAASPYNVVRLILARPGADDVPQPERDGTSDYRHVAALLARWRADGVLRRDAAPCLYVYEELYELRGARRVQRGVLASVALDDTGTWVVPHERTMAAPVADRLRLLEATEANLSPIFGVYAGAGGPAAVLDDVTGGEPALDCVDETGVRHRLWAVADPDRIAAWRERMAAQRVLIADGHHRYRTSLAYRDAMRAANGGRPGPWDELLMFLVDADLHGPAVLAIHRLLAGVDGATVLAGLEGDFDARPAASPAEAEQALGRLPEDAVAFGLYAGGRSWLLVARDPAGLAAEAGRDRRMLDVEVLHGPVLSKRLGRERLRGPGRLRERPGRRRGRGRRGRRGQPPDPPPGPVRRRGRDRRRRRDPPPEDHVLLPKPRDGLVLRLLDESP